MERLLWVGSGGFVGSALRYLVSGAVQRLSQSIGFPYGTLAVNVLGCLAIGFLAQLVETRGLFSTEARLFVFVGLLGGFTTYSTFGNESVTLLRGGQGLLAFANVSAHIFLGLGAVWLGRALAVLLWR